MCYCILVRYQPFLSYDGIPIRVYLKSNKLSRKFVVRPKKKTTNYFRSCRPDKNECVHTDCEGNVKWLWIQHNKSIKINPPTTLKCYAFAQMHAAFLDNCVMGMMERFLSLPVSHYNILHFKTRVYLQTEKERH